MTININGIRSLLSNVADRLSRQGFSFRMTEGALLFLDDIRLYRPTADAGTLLQLEYVFDSEGLRDRQLPEALRQILGQLIRREEAIDPDFDFGRIESLTASKGFGEGFSPRINGSWFRNLSAWGKGMYPGDNLRSDTLQDWNDNVRHIEHEGFSRNYPLRVTYYDWYDRYVASNSGGSHHAAKVIWQGHRDSVPYRREAKIEKLSIDTEAVGNLESRFFSFMYLPRNHNTDNEFRLLLSTLVSKNARYLAPVKYHENLKFVFIPREDLRGRQALFSQWLTTAAGAGKIISLPGYLKTPQAYHNKPYLHDVTNICLGVPV